jgi:hypothetical protein
LKSDSACVSRTPADQRSQPEEHHRLARPGRDRLVEGLHLPAAAEHHERAGLERAQRPAYLGPFVRRIDRYGGQPDRTGTGLRGHVVRGEVLAVQHGAATGGVDPGRPHLFGHGGSDQVAQRGRGAGEFQHDAGQWLRRRPRDTAAHFDVHFTHLPDAAA